MNKTPGETDTHTHKTKKKKIKPYHYEKPSNHKNEQYNRWKRNKNVQNKQGTIKWQK
jgi:hypothetical protein